ncbi:hypothetical protein BKA82DRAFT_991263 [Pisolithus tinctorius]|uniref:Uncharacterized protein n=1 Tax=Pisolithus tinctorius Marx 270 TaxID=870435 RepID=A0A0C3JZD5_PISTI|nr:hypothetical protein BKA82DRAFT_991263 [Pisolithus tinctorius]KIO14518.1 hypothetical protein M404DRAFT_991263 [Pisolithus tinctorius Marx 270]
MIVVQEAMQYVGYGTGTEFVVPEMRHVLATLPRARGCNLSLACNRVPPTKCQRLINEDSYTQTQTDSIAPTFPIFLLCPIFLSCPIFPLFRTLFLPVHV